LSIFRREYWENFRESKIIDMQINPNICNNFIAYDSVVNSFSSKHFILSNNFIDKCYLGMNVYILCCC
jgi:hypothetical protein